MDMTTPFKAAARGVWALGDYHEFALSTVWGLGPVLVKACGIGTGQRVLDVATGTGNVAIRAAKAGASVVASDLTPENFPAGRRAAETEGVEVEWVEADAEALPFDDAEFDVVTSCLGVIFAPDHDAAAGELLRVCRPGGTIGMINFTPDGAGGEFFRLLSKYLPPPPAGARPPVLWGDEQYVRKLFGGHVRTLEVTRQEYVETADNPAEYYALFQRTFGPMLAIRASLAGTRDRIAALDREFLEFVGRSNRGKPGGPVEIPYDYLLVVASRR
jgi:ubiquinone/menaquinone biosynthesis C-methylase UbiE